MHSVVDTGGRSSVFETVKTQFFPVNLNRDFSFCFRAFLVLRARFYFFGLVHAILFLNGGVHSIAHATESSFGLRRFASTPFAFRERACSLAKLSISRQKTILTIPSQSETIFRQINRLYPLDYTTRASVPVKKDAQAFITFFFPSPSIYKK